MRKEILMYCVNCGVKLAEGERECPLCKTEVYHPKLGNNSGERSFPTERIPPNRVSSWGSLFILTLIFILPIIIAPLSDIHVFDRMTWSWYVILGTILGYVLFVLPMWFSHPNPVIFIPVDFAGCALYLLFVDLYTGGTHWFLPLAFPLTVGLAVIVCTAITLLRYVKRGKLYIYGGSIIATALLIAMTEHLIVQLFDTVKYVGWSLYPALVLFLFGFALILIAIIRPLRESLEKKFFIEPPKS